MSKSKMPRLVRWLLIYEWNWIHSLPTLLWSRQTLIREGMETWELRWEHLDKFRWIWWISGPSVYIEPYVGEVAVLSSHVRKLAPTFVESLHWPCQRYLPWRRCQLTSCFTIAVWLCSTIFIISCPIKKSQIPLCLQETSKESLSFNITISCLLTSVETWGICVIMDSEGERTRSTRSNYQHGCIYWRFLIQ